MPLTDVKVRNADPKQKAYRIPDAKGLHLFVTPSGGKLWRWKYRFNGAQKLMALGKYPEVSLAVARDRHAAARRQLAADQIRWLYGRPRRSLSRPVPKAHSSVLLPCG